MRIWSDSFKDGEFIPVEFAMGKPGGFAPNLNPHLAWNEVPQGTRSFMLICSDVDAPTDPTTVGRTDMEVPAEQSREEFIHWVMVDIDAQLRGIAAGSCSNGVTTGGKNNPPGPKGARQGLNSYTHYFANDSRLKGTYLGYDGPYPPFNDARIHRYVFRLFALDLDRLKLPAKFTSDEAFQAADGHILADAMVRGAYTLNPRLADAEPPPPNDGGKELMAAYESLVKK
jgi:Raf kinase inhibitor-like YbhB/YbcL family protein